jgi:hypothetical protein
MIFGISAAIFLLVRFTVKTAIILIDFTLHDIPDTESHYDAHQFLC